LFAEKMREFIEIFRAWSQFLEFCFFISIAIMW